MNYYETTSSDARRPISTAFVDVDETLVRDITFLSLFEFDAHRREGRPACHSPAAEHETVQRFRSLRAAGLGRADSHRWLYRHWAGRDVADVRAVGREWFTDRSAAAGYFNEAVLRRLAEIADTGAHIVLVSGSFDAALAPIAEQIRAHAVLCTDLEIDRGRYTGSVTATMVGPDKAVAVRRYADEHGIDLRDCAAFGDHHSDISMFDLVGHPVVVGDADPALRGYPAERLAG
ncbi:MULTISPECIES: HAD family hydrolase [Nocardia]|uniref:HAD family hydrolase n=1 Tax=Nocardia TaxID=1817 RepID=UPI000D699797|nr:MULTISPECIES: HAD-IB family hydrolase [Nocardia]